MSDFVIKELERVIGKLEREKRELQSQVGYYENAIKTIENIMEEMAPNKSAPIKFKSVGEAVKHLFHVNLDRAFTSIDVSNALEEMIDQRQLKLGKNQKLNRLVHSTLYTLYKKGHLQKRASDNPLVDYEYLKPFELVESS